MRLFTSNSDKNSEHDTFIKSILLLLFVFLLMCSGFEIFWRGLGHRPSITDDMKLWSMEMKKLEKKDNKTIALIGASRIMTDLSTDSLRSNFPGYTISNLAITGQGCIAVLHELADNVNFSGLVICDITEDMILKSDDSTLLKPYINCFQKNFGLNSRINREISTVIQSNFVIFDPHLNLILIAGYLVDRHKLRPPRYIHTLPDRSIVADYSQTDSIKIKEVRIKARYNDFQKLGNTITPYNFLKNLGIIQNDIAKINNRGGEVVFIRFPISGEILKIDDDYCPKNLYWDKLAGFISAKTIHFKDYETLRGFNCPDFSHLDIKDVPVFSSALINELKKLNFFRKDNH